MRLRDISLPNYKNPLWQILSEGGWDSTVTQSTTITPKVVKAALNVVDSFVKGFNQWLVAKGSSAVEIGHPLGSTAWHTADPEDKVYGDIDLQMVAQPLDTADTPSKFAAHWNKLLDDYIAAEKPSMVYDIGKPVNGHVIFALGNDHYVQVDMIWTEPKLASWARYRMTPAHNIKGATYGNLFSTLGEIMHMSIQSAGVQMKIKDGEPVPFSKSRKFDTLETLTTDIERFGLDIVKQLYRKIYPGKDLAQLKIDPLLKKRPGVDTNAITAANLVSVVNGVAKTFELNNMYGHYNLKEFSDYDNFIEKFKSHYMEKLHAAINATKFDKAETPEAKARAEDVKEKLLSHGTAIMNLL
jgi:hypothetical protein